MGKRLWFLIGILAGQLIMAPYIIHLIKTPRIELLVIPDWYQAHKETFHVQIKNMHNKYYLGGTTLNIYIASEEKVQAEYEREFGTGTEVGGFYNVKTNTIWSTYDPLVLCHEWKHVTEGEWHR